MGEIGGPLPLRIWVLGRSNWKVLKNHGHGQCFFGTNCVALDGFFAWLFGCVSVYFVFFFNKRVTQKSNLLAKPSAVRL